SAPGLNRDSILRDLGKGVLITGFNGGNYNQVTGDFSFGIRGFYFEGGAPVHSVREMNITGNIVTLFSSLRAVGDDPSDISAARIPTLAFDSGNLA
ncbi:MAG: TldD/PmbA family protein, partial [Bacteroidales bacterium]|nr:TldD/PmbA family protein [Bacteroidales bacterium]